MTPDERSLLLNLLADLRTPSGAAKDPEAEQMIQQAVTANPDAVYMLVQHAILAGQALHAAQAQIAQLSGQNAATSSSFLPSLSGGGSSSLRQEFAPPSPGLSPWACAQGAPVPSNPFAADSGLGGFLRNAGTMAAGVAAGDFLAEGISNIFGRRW